MTKPPNIVWIMCDQMRHDCTGYAGHPLMQTPHLDNMAETGVAFNRAYCASPVCSPARASWLTGLYPHAHGQTRNYSSSLIGREGIALHPDCMTIGDVLKNAGYRCGIVGPWHIGYDHRPQHGFTDYWWTYRYQGGHPDCLDEYFKKEGVENLYIKGIPAINSEVQFMHYAVTSDPRQQRTTWTIDRGLDFLRQADDRPWFLFLSVKDPHPIIVTPPHTLEHYPIERIELPETWRDPMAGKPKHQLEQFIDRGRIHDDVTEDMFRRMMAHYYGLITHIDEQVGRVIDQLRQSNALENTIVVFMSDHGEMLGAHGYVAKMLMYEESVRVPCVMTWPAGLGAPMAINAPLGGVDLMPTLLDLAGIPLTRPIDGRSVADALRNGQEPALRPVFAEISTWDAMKAISDDPTDLAARVMILDDQVKYVWNRTDDDELYNLADDPTEMNNLAQASGERARIDSMRQRCGEMVQQTGPAVYEWCVSDR